MYRSSQKVDIMSPKNPIPTQPQVFKFLGNGAALRVMTFSSEGAHAVDKDFDRLVDDALGSLVGVLILIRQGRRACIGSKWVRRW